MSLGKIAAFVEIENYICNKNNVNSLSGRGFLAAVVSQSTGSSEEFQGMAVNNLSSTMMDKSFLENISSILRDFSDLSEENKIYLCQPQHLRFIVNLLLQENTTVVENASVILKNISKCLAVTESFRLILSQNGCYEKLLQLLQSPNMNIVSNTCKILKSLSEGCSSDLKTLVDLGAVALLSQHVTSRHEDIGMASSEALQNLLTFRNTFFSANFNSGLDGQWIHCANPVNHTGVPEGSADQPIISSNRGTEFEEFMLSSSPELPKSYCTEGTPDSRFVHQYPTLNVCPVSYLGNANSNQRLLTEAVQPILNAEEVPVDYSTQHSAEFFSGSSSVSSMSRLSLRSLEKPLESAQLSMLKKGLGSDFELVQLICCQEIPSSSLPSLSTKITSTPSRSLFHNNVEALSDDSPKNTSTSSSSSSFSCFSDDSNVDESVNLCVELGMSKSKNSKVFVCPERKSCEGSSLDQTTAAHQDKNTPSMLERSSFSEDGEENVAVIYNAVHQDKNTPSMLENYSFSEDGEENVTVIYNDAHQDKNTPSILEKSFFFEDDEKIVQCIYNGIDNKKEMGSLKLFSKIIGKFKKKTSQGGGRFEFMNSIKSTKLFRLSLRKKKNRQVSNPNHLLVLKGGDGKKTKKRTLSL